MSFVRVKIEVPGLQLGLRRRPHGGEDDVTSAQRPLRMVFVVWPGVGLQEANSKGGEVRGERLDPLGSAASARVDCTCASPYQLPSSSWWMIVLFGRGMY